MRARAGAACAAGRAPSAGRLNMTSHDAQRTMHVTIQPGEYHCSRDRVIISTLLGSCISACLYDPVKRVVGMNHFLLSANAYPQGPPVPAAEAGRYGNSAMELVIDGMIRLGAERFNLRAKVFGGSSFFNTSTETDILSTVGDGNRRFISEFLRERGIPIVAGDMGGDQGRVIRFSSVDYSVQVRKIPKAKSPGIADRERLIVRQSVENRNRILNRIDFWT